MSDERKINASDQIEGLETQLMHLRMLHGTQSVGPSINCFYLTANKAVIFVCATGESIMDPGMLSFLSHINGIKEKAVEEEGMHLIIPDEVKARVAQIEAMKDFFIGVVIKPSEVPDGPLPGTSLQYHPNGIYHTCGEPNFQELGLTLVKCLGHISMLGVQE